jgi:hypothetical protein
LLSTDEANRAGRLHTQHNQQGLYSITRHITRSLAPNSQVKFSDADVHANDPPQSGAVTFSECASLADHLHKAFGVTSLLPRDCAGMLNLAKPDTAQDYAAAGRPSFLRT